MRIAFLRPRLIILLVFAACLAAIHPFGDYPLNDDWQYARAAKVFAESGKIRIDTPIAPSLVGQMLLAYPVIRVFGMNHAALRALTWVMAAVCLLCVDRLLTLGSVRASWRTFAALVLLINPLFLYFANTFMTEVYGFAPSLLAAVVYFEYRKRIPNPFDSRRSFYWGIASWSAIACLSAFAFWIRQFAAIAFPILLVTWMLTAPRVPAPHRWKALLVAAFSCLIFAVAVASYFFWATASGNLSFAFSDPLERMMHVNVVAWRVQTGALIVYLTGFFAPMLAFAGRSKWSDRTSYLIGAVLLALVWITIFWFRSHAPSDFVFDGWLHRVFPYVTNVIYRTGIGPITLDDVYHQSDTQRPQWTSNIWPLIEWILVIGTLLWGFVIRRMWFFWRARTTAPLRREIVCFFLLWSLASWVVTLQAYRLEIFDRYYFPVIVCLSIVLPLLLTVVREDAPSRFNWHHAAAAICVAALAWFSIAGLHDHFRWNDARWNLANFLFSQGVSPADLAAGFEVNGWKNYDNFLQGKTSTCRSPGYVDWFCSGDTYRIGMNGRPDYQEWKREQPSYWLAPGPPILLLRRIQPSARD